MTFRKHLGWPVPRDPWQAHIDAVHDKFGTTDLYAGVIAEYIALLWIEIEGTDPDAPDLPTGDPTHTQKKKNSKTPLSEQETEYVQVRFHPDVADQLRGYAKEYDVNNGVLLGYILREYYETDGWGYSIEAVGSGPTVCPETGDVPYGEAAKADWIAERVETEPNGFIHESSIREVVERAGAASRFVDYRDAVLDRLDYVYHPNTTKLYVPRDHLADLGISPTAPAYYRKPFDLLDRGEKIEGLKQELESMDQALTARQVHNEIFNGNGSASHIRDLVHAVAEMEDFTYHKTPSGKKVLRYVGSRRSPSTEPKPDPTGESESEDDRKRREDVEADAVEQMDALMSGYDTNPETDSEGAATDGGREQEQ